MIIGTIASWFHFILTTFKLPKIGTDKSYEYREFHKKGTKDCVYKITKNANLQGSCKMSSLKRAHCLAEWRRPPKCEFLKVHLFSTKNILGH